MPDEAPVKVKRYGFLRFLLVLLMLFLLSIRLPFLPEQEDVQEDAFGTGIEGAPVSEFEKLSPAPRPAAFDASHDALVQGMYSELPTVPEDDEEDAAPVDGYDEEVTGS